MADHADHLPMAQRPDHADRVTHDVQRVIAPQIAVIVYVTTSGAAVASQIRGDDVKACVGEAWHHGAPGVGEFREAVQ